MDSGNPQNYGGTIETSKSARCLSWWAMRSMSTSRALQRRTCGLSAERMLWGAHVEGLALVYVDDAMLFGTKEVVEQGLQCFQKYCGMELSRTEHGDCHANQCSYLWEAVRRHGMEDLCSAQLMKDSQEPETELNAPMTQVKEAQQLAGELLWLATQTRPDIAYVVSRICSAASRAPSWAIKTHQLIRHLNATQGLGLWYRRDAPLILESVSDASFAAGGAHSHGCAITTLGGTPVAWKTGSVNSRSRAHRGHRSSGGWR